jgi:hypothetical protein
MDRRFAEIIDLAGQHPGDPAGEEQGQIGRRVVGLRASLPEWRNRDDGGGLIDPPERVRVVLSPMKIARPSFADDQAGRRDCGACRRRIARDYRLAVIKVAGERRRQIRLYATDLSAYVGEKAPTDGRGRSAANLCDLKPSQYRHKAIPKTVSPAGFR